MKRIELVTADDLELKLAENLMQGQMPDPFLYIGESGARNWFTLNISSDYPIAARLQYLLQDNLPLIREFLEDRNLVSLGVGLGEKERILLEVMACFGSPRYVAVDISSRMVETALAAVEDTGVERTGLVAFVEDFPLIKEHWEPPVLLCMLGNSFCYYHPEHVLELIREHIGSDDLFMFDCHLLTCDSDWEQAESIYHSRQNVLFNIGPLVDRGMEPDACVFNLELIEQEADGERVCRTSKWLDIIKDSTVSCGMFHVRLEAGAKIELGFTYKFTQEQVSVCLQEHGFEVLRCFTGSGGEDLLVIVRKQ